jgi:hypothetical protein
MKKKSNIFSAFSKHPQLISCIALGIAVFSVYYPVLSNEFLMHWDDQWVVINNYTYNGFEANNLRMIFTEFYHGQYAPLNQLYYTALYSVFGLNPSVFHLGSLLLHYANVLLVYCFLRRILSMTGGFGSTYITGTAFIAAMLFAVHPFNVESVAWISASKIPLYSFFFLLAMISYLRYAGGKKLKYYFIALALFVLSFGGKEQAVSLSLTVILLDSVLGRNLKDKRIWFEKIPFLVLALAGGIITVWSVGGGYMSGEGSYPFYQRIVFSSYALMEYFVKCIAPVKLSYLYMYPNLAGESVPLNFWIYPVLALVLLTAFIYRFNIRKHRYAYFLLLFFIANLAVTLHVISLPRFTIIADRYVYISSIAVFLGIAMLFVYATERYPNFKRLLFTGLAIYMLSVGLYSHERSKVWHDTDSLKKELREHLEQRNRIDGKN